jgi:hypothetical protein
VDLQVRQGLLVRLVQVVQTVLQEHLVRVGLMVLQEHLALRDRVVFLVIDINHHRQQN